MKRTEPKHYIETPPLLPNRGLELEYARELEALFRPLIRETYSEIMEIYRREKWQITLDGSGNPGGRYVAMDGISDLIGAALVRLRKKFEERISRKAREVAGKMVDKVVDFAIHTFLPRVQKVIPKGIEIEIGRNEKTGEILMASVRKQFLPGKAKEAIEAAIIENVNLIRSIPPQYLDRVAGAVTRSIQSDGSIEDLAKKIRKYGKMSMQRARNIALDQTRKTYTAITIRQLQQMGVKKWRWHHVENEKHPRPWHLGRPPHGLNGGIFDLDNPPIIEPRTGERGFPAQLPFCRCSMSGILDFP